MSVIQIREVSDETSARLKHLAENESKSLSEYLRGELDRIASRPTLAEMLERVASRGPVRGRSAATMLRDERDRRS